ncbi:MAG TPA: thiol peroxidase, partial [Candidatus Hydrogenedentes bacterium]|nr:thiol peroxidase [Candidatus Hydrogenedentota bacterium]
MAERSGAVTFQGNPLTVIGNALEVGAKAPGFTLLSNELQPVTLEDSAGKVRLIAAVPSLDTPV